MKRILFILIAVFVASLSKAQQLPLFTQYYNNEFLYNPSQTLTEVSPSLTMLYRKQWVQLEGPTTKGVLFQAPLVAEKVGIGVQLFNDRIGIFDQTGGKVSYSYQLNLNDEHRLLLGLSAGYFQTNFVWDEGFLNSTIDPEVLNRVGDKVNSFDADFGLTYAWKELEVGIAVPHLLANDANFLSPNDNILFYPNRHFLGSASYKFNFGDGLSLRPLLMARYHPSVPVQFDVNAIFDYQNKFWLAASYRHDYAFSGAFGVKLHERFDLGYSYDFSTSDIASYGGATHEIVFTLRMGKVAGMLTKDEQKEIEEKELEKQQSLDDLKLELAQLRKRIREQADSLTNHESRITALENAKDSIAEIVKNEVQEQLKQEKVGSGSYDVRDPNAGPQNYNQRTNPIINPEDQEAPYGRKKDGTPIGANENYNGPKYDKEGNEITNRPESKELYDVNGNKIKDIDNYVGPIYNANGEKIGENKAPRSAANNGGSNNGGVNNNPSTSSYNGKNYTREELNNDGIKYTAPGNYLVVASFRSKENSLKQLQQMEENGINGGIVYNHFRKWFYVYTLDTDDFDEAITKLREARAGDNPDAWIHVILE